MVSFTKIPKVTFELLLSVFEFFPIITAVGQYPNHNLHQRKEVLTKACMKMSTNVNFLCVNPLRRLPQSALEKKMYTTGLGRLHVGW